MLDANAEPNVIMHQQRSAAKFSGARIIAREVESVIINLDCSGAAMPSRRFRSMSLRAHIVKAIVARDVAPPAVAIQPSPYRLVEGAIFDEHELVAAKVAIVRPAPVAIDATPAPCIMLNGKRFRIVRVKVKHAMIYHAVDGALVRADVRILVKPVKVAVIYSQRLRETV